MKAGSSISVNLNRMKYLVALFFSSGLLFSSGSNTFGQEMPPDNVNYDILVDKFYREHIPLDGDKVKFIPFRKDSLFGFVEKYTQKVVLKPAYEQVFATYAEGAIVSEDSEYYDFIDYSGKILLGGPFTNMFRDKDLVHGIASGYDRTRKPPLSDSYLANYFYNVKTGHMFNIRAHTQGGYGENDYAWFRFDRVYKIYDRDGNLMHSFPQTENDHFIGIFDNQLVFQKELSPEQDASIISVNDIKGKELYRIKPESEVYLKGFRKMNDTLFALVTDGEILLVNEKGALMPYGVYSGTVGFGFHYAYNEMVAATELLKVVDPETKLVGILRKDGKLLSPVTQKFQPDPEGKEFAFLDETTFNIGFKNDQGAVVVPAMLSQVYFMYPFSNDFEIDGRIMYRNNLFRVSLPKEENGGYIDSGDDENAPGNKRYSYLDRTGKVAFTLSDDIYWAGHFSDGFAPVLNNKRALGFIDTTGKLVIPCKYELAVAGAYPMPYVVIPEFKNGFAYLKAFKGYIDKNGKEYFSGKRVEDKYDFSH